MSEINKATLHEVEKIKRESQNLRGTLTSSLANAVTGALAKPDQVICKFHGLYQQDDRDIRHERQERKLEPLYSFMLRGRLPAGVCSSAQWLALDRVCREFANGSIRLTTRQTFQFHGICKNDIKSVIQSIDQVKIDSIGACGDVNRNVICGSNPRHDQAYQQVRDCAVRLSEHLLPKTRAYYEIWLDQAPIAQSGEPEPIYGDAYLPRKFKTAFAIPPSNDVDIYANDMGFIAILEGERLRGFNVLAGGGMGMVHRDASTYPRIATTLGYIDSNDLIPVAEAILKVQRDYGERSERKHARLKYTIDRMRPSVFRQYVEQYSGIPFAPAVDVAFTTNQDQLGWKNIGADLWHLILYIPHGRICDQGDYKALTALRRIAEEHLGGFRITANQNLMLTYVPTSQKKFIADILQRYGLLTEHLLPSQTSTLACVALPTCPLAMAEAERYLDPFNQKFIGLLQKYGLQHESIVVRISGCPNGCARPFLAELALVGKAPGFYNLYLGGQVNGDRLNQLYMENVDEPTMFQCIEQVLARYALERKAKETFGDFCIRTILPFQKETLNGVLT